MAEPIASAVAMTRRLGAPRTASIHLMIREL
jgi:hypothetical protein